MITFRQIEAFRALMISGTVVQAANRLFVTQPAVSRLIGDLEDSLGYALFGRKRGRLVPTEEAKRLFAEVERAFVGISQIEKTAIAIGKTQMGSIRIVAQPVFAAGLLPATIKKLTTRHPDVQISIELRDHKQVLDWVASQQHDLGIATLPVDHESVIVESLGKDDAVMLIPEGHIMQTSRSVTIEELNDEVLIKFPDSTKFGFTVSELLTEYKVRPRTVIEASSAEAVKALVAAGVGVALVARFALYGAATEGIVVKDFHPRFFLEFGLLRPANQSPSRLADELSEEIRAFFKHHKEVKPQKNPVNRQDT